MIVPNRFERSLLFVGDIIALFAALWLMLLVRYGSFTSELFLLHLAPFSILFLVWIFVFFIAGLYEKHTVILKSRIPSLLFSTLVVNTVIAIAFFYFVPYFGITPKTNLFVYLVISFILVLLWRIYGYPLLGSRRKQNALLIGSGSELRELRDEVNNNSRYSIKFVSSVDLDAVDKLDFKSEVLDTIYSQGIQIVAVDLQSEKVNPILPHLYNLIYSKVRFIDMYKVYEDIFDRVPLSLLRYNWFLENISLAPKFTYDFLKRVMDVVISIPLLIVPALTLPFAFAAMKLEDGGELFSHQKRVGRNNKPIELIKFRTMTIGNDDGAWDAKTYENKVTKTGAFLRKTRLDEFPQLWNVIRGDISLIGPRPEFPAAVKEYEKEIPYYSVRHLIKPGLSGWAQIYGEHPHHGTDMTKTKNKLSYDLYYIKNRSFLVDLKIALHTIRELLSRKGI
ncbi:MAG TPA: exopolysaccharide biosynthesis polyprenyl glycosylphosphotransferase [Candidatus Paceibacterota bacterium]